MRLVADRHKVKVLHSWQGVVRTGNGKQTKHDIFWIGRLARIWEDNHNKDIYKLQVVECPTTPGVLLHPITWFPPGKVGARAYLLERVDFDNVKRSLLFGGRQRQVSQKLHDMICSYAARLLLKVSWGFICLCALSMSAPRKTDWHVQESHCILQIFSLN